MIYTSKNLDFFVELEKKYKESVYCVYYIIKGTQHNPNIFRDVLSNNKDWSYGKPTRTYVELSIEYLDNLNQLIAIILDKDITGLSGNATLPEIITAFDLPVVTVEQKKHWGNYYWAFLHYTSIYMNILKDNNEVFPKLYPLFYNMIYNLRMILICIQCFVNYQSKLTQVKEFLELAKTDAISAIFKLHSLVNEHTNPIKYKDYTFEDFLQAYDLVNGE